MKDMNDNIINCKFSASVILFPSVLKIHPIIVATKEKQNISNKDHIQPFTNNIIKWEKKTTIYDVNN